MRYRNRRMQQKENQHTERWLVSYADYMTIMFALFVVMYAIAINKNEHFSVLSLRLEQVFSNKAVAPANTPEPGVDTEILNHPHTPSTQGVGQPSTVPSTPKTSRILHEQADVSLVSQKEQGQSLGSLLDSLTDALREEISNGEAELTLNENWLSIELSSGLLFPSASATVTNRAQAVLSELVPLIAPINNLIRVRGYTDNQGINNELFRSNWQLSAARAAQIVRELETLGINPARMALEGYGQYSPSADNSTEQGRAKNRKVVIAISKYALVEEPTPVEQANSAPHSEEAAPVAASEEQPSTEINNGDSRIKIIQLPHGGIRITTREQEGEQ